MSHAFLLALLLSHAPAAEGIVLQAPALNPTFVVLNYPDSSYLQMEAKGVSASATYHIDSVRLDITGRPRLNSPLIKHPGNLHVHVGWGSTEYVGSAKHTVQILHRLPYPGTPYDSVLGHSFQLDTIFVHLGTGSTPEVVTSIPHVDHLAAKPRTIPLPPTLCWRETSSMARDRFEQEFRSLLAAYPIRVVLNAPMRKVERFTDWTLATGKESFPGIVAALPGNQGNWFRTSYREYSVSALPVRLPGTDTTTKLPDNVSLPSGLVEYAFHRSRSPKYESLEENSLRRFDSLTKIGHSLRIDGPTRTPETNRIDHILDSLHYAWLVLTKDTGVDSLAAAMEPSGNCGWSYRRARAWPLEGKLVRIDDSTTFDLATLADLGSSNAASPRASDDRVRLSAHPNGVRVDLQEESSIAITTASGKSLRQVSTLSVGSHVLPLPDASGLILVRVRTGSDVQTFRLVR